MTLTGDELSLNSEQLSKAEASILVRLEVTGIYASLPQPLKAETPISRRLAAPLILINSLQFWYLQPIITQYFIDNKSEIWLLFLIAHSKR